MQRRFSIRIRRRCREVSTLRRHVLALSGVKMLASYGERVSLWFYRVDLLRFCAARRNCTARVRWWRGDVAVVQVLRGDSRALPAALIDRQAEQAAIQLVAARMARG